KKLSHKTLENYFSALSSFYEYLTYEETSNNRSSQQAGCRRRHIAASDPQRIAQDPLNEERRNAWYALDSGVGGHVMVRAEYGGVRGKKRPVSFDTLEFPSQGHSEPGTALKY
ncbi:MAG: hypothetical protein KKD33_04595, partial [Verrucomicrobia bacterium]|nr:hypothetical protein [Verrucomicrobiota bacterium]